MATNKETGIRRYDKGINYAALSKWRLDQALETPAHGNKPRAHGNPVNRLEYLAQKGEEADMDIATGSDTADDKPSNEPRLDDLLMVRTYGNSAELYLARFKRDEDGKLYSQHGKPKAVIMPLGKFALTEEFVDFLTAYTTEHNYRLMDITKTPEQNTPLTNDMFQPHLVEHYLDYLRQSREYKPNVPVLK